MLLYYLMVFSNYRLFYIHVRCRIIDAFVCVIEMVAMFRKRFLVVRIIKIQKFWFTVSV